MPTLVSLPKEIVKVALEGASTLRLRQIKAATNPVIIGALEQEVSAIATAINTLETLPDDWKPQKIK